MVLKGFHRAKCEYVCLCVCDQVGHWAAAAKNSTSTVLFSSLLGFVMRKLLLVGVSLNWGQIKGVRRLFGNGKAFGRTQLDKAI